MKVQATLWGMGISTKKCPKEVAQGSLESSQGTSQGLDFG